MNDTTNNTTIVFQHGFAVFGEGADLFEALEDAAQWADDLPTYDEIEMYERSGRVVGEMYWSNNPDTVREMSTD